MHHKFSVIDDRLVMMGSFNFTMSAINQNYESIVLIKTSSIVASFKSEFNSLWEKFN